MAPAKRKGMNARDLITEKLTTAFAPARLDVVDESHLHAGHAGHRPGGETHFRVTIVAEAFRGKSRLERHPMVNEQRSAGRGGAASPRPRSTRQRRKTRHDQGAAGVFARSRPSAVNPVFLSVPSQKDLFDEAPQRQRKVSVARVTVRRVPETTSSGPWIISGPLRSGFIASGPFSRTRTRLTTG